MQGEKQGENHIIQVSSPLSGNFQEQNKFKSIRTCRLQKYLTLNLQHTHLEPVDHGKDRV